MLGAARKKRALRCAQRTLLEVLRGSVNELEGDKLEAALLETADDVADDATLDAVGL